MSKTQQHAGSEGWAAILSETSQAPHQRTSLLSRRHFSDPPKITQGQHITRMHQDAKEGHSETCAGSPNGPPQSHSHRVTQT